MIAAAGVDTNVGLGSALSVEERLAMGVGLVAGVVAGAD
jgi:hypothetical protein